VATRERRQGVDGWSSDNICLCYPGAVTLSGKDGDDAKPYQEKQVKQAIEEIE